MLIISLFRCEVAEYIKFDVDVQVDSSNFYTHMKMVEVKSNNLHLPIHCKNM